jgi:SAM-dependent methyltransferase
VVGVDRDRQRLSEALPQAVLLADLAALPFAPATFDRVLFSEVLEHIPADADALQTLFHLLVPGGILAISVPCAHYPFWWDPISRIRDLLGMPPLSAHSWIATIWSNHVRLYSPAHLTELLVGAGFVVEEIELQTRTTVPFAHFIVYSIGKALLDRQILPTRWRAYADRRMGEANDGRWWHPFNLVRAVFRWCDLPNDRRIDQRGPGVIIVAKARKPQAEAPL